MRADSGRAVPVNDTLVYFTNLNDAALTFLLGYGVRFRCRQRRCILERELSTNFPLFARSRRVGTARLAQDAEERPKW